MEEESDDDVCYGDDDFPDYYGEAEETERINQQGGGEETENHSIFLSEASTVKRAV